MSRNYAQFTTSIWRPEDDFGDLTWQAQWAYFMLGTQPDISAAGVLSLNVRRWSKRARNVTREFVIEALQELQSANKVHYDYDTEELLIRTFVKADGGYGNRKRRPVIERAALELESARLRTVLAEELRKLGDAVMTLLADRLSAPYGIAYAAERPENVSPASPATQQPPTAESDESAFPQVDSLSDSLSDSTCRFDGVVVTKGLEVVPQPATHNPQPQPPAGAPTAPPKKRATNDDKRGTRLPLDWAPGAELLEWFAGKRFSFNHATETEKFVNYWHAKPGKDGTKLDWNATWRKWMLTAADRQPRTGDRPPIFNGAVTGANRHNDPADRKPFIFGVVASKVTAQQTGAS